MLAKKSVETIFVRYFLLLLFAIRKLFADSIISLLKIDLQRIGREEFV